MRLSKFLGRILIAILFVNAGISQYVNQDSFIHYFNIRYPLYHKFASNLLGSTLDQIEILNPNNLIKITPYLILGSGILQILLGLCVGIGIQKAGYALQNHIQYFLYFLKFLFTQKKQLFFFQITFKLKRKLKIIQRQSKEMDN